MNDQFADLVAAARQWVEEGTAAEWVEAGSAERFAALERATPADLFVDAQARPLVVALFGGTGVGKSSLLNRLAGATVARVGVERPTSREITLYVHHDVKLADFPETLPLESVEVRRHGDDAHKNILWIDAPDIDSVEPQNRACALAWLPHIDLLVYVVSPERYRDDVGWRVLQDRSLRHGWMFVMNRWDEGDRAQRDDFARMMRTAGFDDPLVLCTSCLDGAELPSSDEFARIEAVINDLLAAHGVRELTRLGHRARLQELRATLQAAGARLGDEHRWQAVATAAPLHWQQARDVLRDGLDWPIRDIAARMGARANTPGLSLTGRALGLLRKDEPGGEKNISTMPDASELAYLTESLWDDWSDAKLRACMDAIEGSMRHEGIVAAPLRARLDKVAGTARGEMLARMQDEVRAALASPGTIAQRVARRVTGFLAGVLPFAALAWVAVTLVMQYFRASTSTGPASYPTTDFVVSSLLLVALAWAVPFWLDRMLRPSVARTVLRAMRAGVRAGLDELERRIHQALDETTAEADTWRGRVDKLLKQIAGILVRPVRTDQAEISRFIAVGRNKADATAHTDA